MNRSRTSFRTLYRCHPPLVSEDFHLQAVNHARHMHFPQPPLVFRSEEQDTDDGSRGFEHRVSNRSCEALIRSVRRIQVKRTTRDHRFCTTKDPVLLRTDIQCLGNVRARGAFAGLPKIVLCQIRRRGLLNKDVRSFNHSSRSSETGRDDIANPLPHLGKRRQQFRHPMRL